MSATKIGVANNSYQSQPTAIKRTEDGTSKTYRWHGDYDALNTFQATFSTGGTYDGLTVRDVDLVPEAGGLAMLSVTANNIVAPGSGGGGGDLSPVYELDWQRVDKDIRYHPAFVSGDYVLTNADRQEVDNCLRDPNIDADATLGFNAMELYQRLLRGQTSYPLFVPVARKSSYSTSRPITGDCGTQSTPPSQCGAPAGYVYVKMADKVIKRNGSYERSEEWVGFDEVDEMVYPAS
jgi:hypothetical protein